MANSVFGAARAVLAELMLSARQDAGLLQAELGLRVGKDQTYISAIERGQRRVDVIEFYALARAMGLDPAALYSKLVRAFPDDVII